MTRKDFELIAGMLADYRNESPDLVDAMARTFATHLANRNASFNYARFISAVERAK